MSTRSPNLWRVLSETSRIITAHRRHFLALSVLFLLPVSLSAAIYPFLFQPSSVHSDYYRSLFLVSSQDPLENPSVGKSQVLLPVLYTFSLILFSFCASTSITFTTFHGFHGKPVSFISSLKSILVSFFPLLATRLATQIIFFLLTFVFGIITLLAYSGLGFLGFEMDFDSEYFLVFVILIAVFFVGLLVYLQVQWYLSTAIVVLDSQWGFAPLKRSSYLVKGMRRVVVSMIVFFGILGGLLSIWYWNLMSNADGISRRWISWPVFLQMVVYVVLTTILSVYGLAANTVLYVYCIALHGEMAFKIDEEFGREYVRLPFDDGMSTYVVNVV